MTLLLCIFIVFASIFSPLLPMAMAGLKTDLPVGSHSLTSMLAKSNVMAADAMLELQAWNSLNHEGYRLNQELYQAEEVLHRFPVERIISRAATGTVWRSTDGVKGNQVVVKSLSDLEAVEREFMAMRKIALRPHSGLKPASLVYYGREVGAIVSEYIEGMTWASLEDLSFEENLLIMLQVAEALEHLHAHVGLIHGDIHLRNILIDDHGKAHLIDFSNSVEIQSKEFKAYDVQMLAMSTMAKLAGMDGLPLDGVFLVDEDLTPAWFLNLFDSILEDQAITMTEVIVAIKEHLPPAFKSKLKKDDL